jgi:hypothetical protein
MFIEDFINRLASDGNYIFEDLINIYQMDRSVVSSLSTQIIMGNGFTEKQSILAVRLAKKYAKALSIALKVDVNNLIQNPQFKIPIRVLNTARTVVIRKQLGSNKKLISVAFPYDEGLITLIRSYKKLLSQNANLGNSVNWNADNRTWDFDLREEHVDWINTNILNSSFLADEVFLGIADQIEEVKNSLEKYIPMVVFENNQFVYKNVPNTVPQPTTFDLVNVLLDARKYGITTWGEDIDIALSQLNLSSALYKFLTWSTITTLPLEKEKITIEEIADIVKFSLPCLVIIPGGSELKHIDYCYKLFERLGISTDEMSTLFRLDGGAGKEFNKFVKDNKLNNILTNDSKIVFISGKVPKPLIEAKINFSSVLNLGIQGVHYTLSSYLKNHHFVINYTLKEAHFANM